MLDLSERAPSHTPVPIGLAIAEQMENIGAMTDSPRSVLTTLAAQHRRSLADLSRTIGRNANYLHQYVSLGSPRRLPEDDRRNLAIIFNVDERRLGARDPWTPSL